MAIPNSGGTTLVFSIEIGAETTYGLIQSLSVNSTTERAEAKGPTGNTYAFQEYDNKHELSMTYLEKGTPTGGPAVGTNFTFDPGTGVGSLTWQVNSINASDTVDGFRSVDISATCYPNLDATP